MQCRTTRAIFGKLDSCPEPTPAQPTEDKGPGSLTALNRTFNAVSEKLSSVSKWVCGVNSKYSHGSAYCKSLFSDSIATLKKNANNFLTSHNFWGQIDQTKQVLANICDDPQKFIDNYIHYDYGFFQNFNVALIGLSMIAAATESPLIPFGIMIWSLEKILDQKASYSKDLEYLTSNSRFSLPQLIGELEELIYEGLCSLPVKEAIAGGALTMALKELPNFSPPRISGGIG
jgi:hypothetical protein